MIISRSYIPMKKHVLSLFFQISENPVGCNRANCRHWGFWELLLQSLWEIHKERLYLKPS